MRIMYTQRLYNNIRHLKILLHLGGYTFRIYYIKKKKNGKERLITHNKKYLRMKEILVGFILTAYIKIIMVFIS